MKTYIKRINEKTKIDIIMIASSYGKRMKSHGPIPLISVKKGLRLIDHQINLLTKNLAIDRMILVACTANKAVMSAMPSDAIKIEEVTEGNTSQSINIGLRATKNDVLIFDTDLLFNEEFIKSIDLNNSSIVINDMMPSGGAGCIYSKRMRLESMMYDLPNKWANTVFMKQKEIAMARKICESESNLFGFELMNKMVDIGANFQCCNNINAKVIDICNSKDLDRVGEII